MTDTLIKVLISPEVERITYGREFDTEPFFATRAVMNIINEEPEWAWHRRELIAIEMSVVRAVDFEPRQRGIWRPMIMANPNTGVRAVDMAFYSIRYNGQDGYLVTLDGEKLPEGFYLHYHEDHWRK
jgi:hypothetical protein